MEEELIEDLKTELEITDENFNLALLTSKVKTAVRDVMTARNYPTSYSEEKIAKDMRNFYSQCRAIALNDYSKVGAEFEETHNENGTNRHYISRDKLFAGIIPLGRK